MRQEKHTIVVPVCEVCCWKPNCRRNSVVGGAGFGHVIRAPKCIQVRRIGLLGSTGCGSNCP